MSQLEKETLDLKILNRGKDFLIEQLRQERDGFFGQSLDVSRKVGELETKLLQLNAEGKNGKLLITIFRVVPTQMMRQLLHEGASRFRDIMAARDVPIPIGFGNAFCMMSNACSVSKGRIPCGL